MLLKWVIISDRLSLNDNIERKWMCKKVLCEFMTEGIESVQ